MSSIATLDDMNKRDRAYVWWKKKPVTVRKPFTFALGLVLLCVAPLVGWIPGPGGIAVFLAGIAVLASEFDWAENLKAFFLHTVPKEIKNRWRPTPRWSVTFDITALLLLVFAGIAAYNAWYAPVLSLGIGGICLFMFNRDRLTRLKVRLERLRKR
jgi:hypothetical protein